MGTTLTALQNDDGLQICFVIAIEGYSYLLTDYRSPSDLFNSGEGWNGTGWSSALGGVSLEGTVFQQSIIPWDCKIKGNQISFSVTDYDGNDQLGKDVFKIGAGNETALTSSALSNETTINVKDTSNFPSSGTIYIGTEEITYTGKTAATFTGCSRGKHSPFLNDSGADFGRTHLVNTKLGNVVSPVKVTDTPRVWIGKWCGIWLHKVTGGVIDTKANAELIHAGKIISIQDSSSGATVLSVGSVLDTIRDSSILNDQFIGRVKKGIYIDDDFYLKVRSTLFDSSKTPTLLYGSTQTFDSSYSELTANTWYDIDEFVDIFNQWLQSLSGTSFPTSIHSTIGTAYGNRTFYVEIIEHESNYVFADIDIRGKRHYMQMLGFDVAGGNTEVEVDTGWEREGDCKLQAPLEPIRVRAFQGCLDGALEVEYADGTWVDNTDTFPHFTSFNIDTLGTTGWGLILVKDSLAIARKSGDVNFVEVRSFPELGKTFGLPLSPMGNLSHDNGWGDIRYSEGDELEIKQVVAIEGTLKGLMLRILSTTSVDGYNETTYDLGGTWGSHMGCAIPYSLLDTAFEDAVDGLFLSNAGTILLIDSPTSFESLFLSDLTLRGAYFVFRKGTVRLVAPQTPLEDAKTITLTENNKASPSGQSDHHRTPTQITNEFIRNVFKIEYKRDIREKSKFLEKKTFIFQASVDNYEAKPITVKARNSYSGPSFGDMTEVLAQNVISRLLPAWGKPMQRLRRTIDMSMYLDVAPGDIALLTDSFVRDPSTGERGITNKPALVLSHQFSVTGGMMGEVDLLIGPIDNTVVYAPTAKVDEDATNAGYNAAGPSLTVKANQFSVAIDSKVDAAHFEAGDKIRIEELSPSNPASTTFWEREVLSVSGNVITLTSTISSPAWDSAKEYNVYSQAYGAAQSTQQADCYQADDADNRIVNTRDPYTYGDFSENITLVAPAATEAPEKHSDSWFGDGVPLTTVAHDNMGRMINNLVGYKTSPKAALFHVGGSAIQGPATAAYKAFQTFPIYLGVGPHSSQGGRKITISPFMRSTGGATVYLRLTLSKTPPNVDPAQTPALTTIEYEPPYTQAEFTTSSTSYSAITAQTIPAIYNTGTGIAYVTIELKGSGVDATQYWGLSRFEVGAPGV